METANLTSSRPRRTVASSWPGRRAVLRAVADIAKTITALFALTAVGAVLERVWFALAGATAPHSTVHPTLAAIAGILVTNLRVLALPFILALTRFQTSRRSRLIGDGLVIGALAANALNVGIELGRWQTRLLPYLPHLPLEYLAAATAAAAWLNARRHRITQPRMTAVYAAVTLLLLAAAAAVEVLLTPHAR